MQFISGLGLALGVVALFAAAYVALAWHLARRAGRRWLAVAWLIAVLIFLLAFLTRLKILGAPVSIPPRTAGNRLLLAVSLGVGLAGAGLATLSVWRGLISSPDGRLTFGRIMAGVGAFFGGLLVVMVVLLVRDLWQIGR
jgi:hypothetical protein